MPPRCAVFVSMPPIGLKDEIRFLGTHAQLHAQRFQPFTILCGHLLWIQHDQDLLASLGIGTTNCILLLGTKLGCRVIITDRRKGGNERWVSP